MQNNHSNKKPGALLILVLIGLFVSIISILFESSIPITIYIIGVVGALRLRRKMWSENEEETQSATQQTPYRPAIPQQRVPYGAPRYDTKTGVLLPTQSSPQYTSAGVTPAPAQRAVSPYVPSPSTARPSASGYGYMPNHNTNQHLCEDDNHARQSGESARKLREMDANYNPYQKSAYDPSFSASHSATQTSRLSAAEIKQKKAQYMSLVDAGMMTQTEYKKLVKELS